MFLLYKIIICSYILLEVVACYNLLSKTGLMSQSLFLNVKMPTAAFADICFKSEKMIVQCPFRFLNFFAATRALHQIRLTFNFSPFQFKQYEYL
jgi:hypothetical protein